MVQVASIGVGFGCLIAGLEMWFLQLGGHRKYRLEAITSRLEAIAVQLAWKCVETGVKVQG